MSSNMTPGRAGIALADAAPVILSRKQLAERYGLPTQTLAVWKVNGYGPQSFRVGRYVRYRLEDVLSWEAEQIEAENRGTR
ncbi:helix-turn-helix transcriptional regulator [Brevibacterium moorei]|uniref:helix-turn-helix transcriptional regulator n=1 Tax=Brevibacterium moorei TaxID=2968457 RepID=UPI00211CD895|nr:DNA-binding protein [Brevibacterium sp. 68QC2CO]MCQ9386799.1 DNA-binding protein [Brevibacterium sp. 68QC2CO]